MFASSRRLSGQACSLYKLGAGPAYWEMRVNNDPADPAGKQNPPRGKRDPRHSLRKTQLALRRQSCRRRARRRDVLDPADRETERRQSGSLPHRHSLEDRRRAPDYPHLRTDALGLPVSAQRHSRLITSNTRRLLYGHRIRRHYSEQRAAGQVVHVEAMPGVITAIAAWMLDPVACAGMATIGVPRVAA